MDASGTRSGNRALTCAFRAGTGLCALSVALLAAPTSAQDGSQTTPPEDSAEQRPDGDVVQMELDVPAPPLNAQLPEIEPIVTDEEFAEDIPELSAEDDIELDRPMESIAEFEARLAEEQALADAGAETSGAETGIEGSVGPPDDEIAPIPALVDGDPVEEIGDAPVRDAELTVPLPALDAFDVEPVEFAETEADAEILEVEYGTVVNGLELAEADTEISLRDQFEDLSALEDGDGEASNVAQVAARLEEDSRLIETLLAAQGYYSPTITSRIDRSPEVNGQPLAAVIDVVPGPRYTFAEINVLADRTVPDALIADNMALKVGDPIIAARVQGVEAQIAVTLPQQGYPFAEVGQRDILLDPDTDDGVYTLPVETGPRARFGGFTTGPADGGEIAFDAEHVGLLARFERGELYDSRMVDDLRQALIATGLLSTASVVPELTGEVAGDGTEYVNIAVEQVASPPRTLAASAGFGTGQGLRVSGSWAHRNLFPPEGALIAQAVLGTQEQGAGVTFRRSNAGRRDRSFTAVAEALRSDYEAFEALTGRLAARVSYDSTPLWQKPFTYAYGVQLLGTIEDDFNVETQEREDRTFFIGGLTGQIGIDRSDSLLNPTKGFRATALIEPEGSLNSGFSPYVRARVDGSGYFPFGDSIVLAARASAGTIQGIDRFDLAPSRRFYAGGGGSVRGFAYQQLGPKSIEPNPDFDPTDPDEEDNPFISRPIGGRSFNEASFEVRYRFGDYGVVGFIDAGQVYDSTTPGFSDLRFGAGIGGRFYTNFGPFRVDLATPLDRREGESRINVYVSIGQAF
ncbi:hypothetical protein HME9302_02503 [Alteripontixanthobacter maritimus]|uniref:Bacterial surface antigen (D15) domain-containing protein n=2 Tax=Alteripontixanthobacter maritimus TaxID=2161824 RepID=A0A369Q9Y6_9SPHN|nr:hypothetical protein HME9302_02503 [Alteripontixanthobacter maritimus]